MKYKVGDKVKIKDQKWYDENKDEFGDVPAVRKVFAQGMSEYLGQDMTISSTDNTNKSYYMSEDRNKWVWTDDMIEGLVGEETLKKEYKTHFTPQRDAYLYSGTDISEERSDNTNPAHYKTQDKETWEMMVDIWGEDAFLTFCKLNAFKYRMRAGVKTEDPTEDIKKAKWYEAKIKELDIEIND